MHKLVLRAKGNWAQLYSLKATIPLLFYTSLEN